MQPSEVSVQAQPVDGRRRRSARTRQGLRGMAATLAAAQRQQGDSADLKVRIRLIRELVIRRIDEMYAAELSTLDERERRQTVLAIDALVDFESWARMREQFGLSFEDACGVWKGAIDRLLPSTPPVS